MSGIGAGRVNLGYQSNIFPENKVCCPKGIRFLCCYFGCISFLENYRSNYATPYVFLICLLLLNIVRQVSISAARSRSEIWEDSANEVVKIMYSFLKFYFGFSDYSKFVVSQRPGSCFISTAFVFCRDPLFTQDHFYRVRNTEAYLDPS